MKLVKIKKQYKELAETSGLSESFIIEFTNMADLFPIQGNGQEFSELLETAGVDAMPELTLLKAENFVAKMQEVKEARNLIHRTTNVAEFEGWVVQAKELPLVIEY